MNRDGRRTLGRAAALLLLLVAGIVAPMLAVGAAPKPGRGRPNIILIVTDDQDYASIQHLPKVQRLAAEGMSFPNFFVTTPICCPSRTTFLRGQYVHNHGVLYNFSPGGGFSEFRRRNLDRSTVATWMQRAGYRTGFYGKFLNEYPKGASSAWKPRGWDEFVVVKRGHYVNYTLNVNGRAAKYAKGKGDANYMTRVLGSRAGSLIESAAKANKPFFIQIAPQAAHTPLRPERRFRNKFNGVGAPRTGAFGEVDVSDKPSWVRAWPPMNDQRAAAIDRNYRQRLRVLMSVDAMIGQLQGTLRRTGQLDNTYIIFTSDNGWLAGAHNLEGKQSAYTESIRAPFVVWGPGVPRGAVEERIVLNTDVAPTIAALGRARPPAWVDGRSFAPLLRGEDPGAWRTGALIEYFRYKDRNEDLDRAAWDGDLRALSSAAALPPAYRALRTRDLLYVEYWKIGEYELYDLRSDPDALENLYYTDRASPDLKQRLAQAVAALSACKGAGCKAAEDVAPGW